MNSDGSKLLNLTNDIADNRWSRWSPDGKWIAFTRTQNGNSDIYFISPNGKDIKPVIESEFIICVLLLFLVNLSLLNSVTTERLKAIVPVLGGGQNIINISST